MHELSGRTTRSRLKQIGDRTKVAAMGVLNSVLPKCAEASLPLPSEVRRILVVRANFRMGNIVLLTALLPILRARFPKAKIDLLIGDTMQQVVRGLDIGEVHLVSRKFARAPWRFLRLFVRLRRERYDLAIDGGMSSFSGALYGWLSGATWRIGAQGRNDRFLNIRLKLPPAPNVYQASHDVAHALGVDAHPMPNYVVTAAEDFAARRLIERWLPSADPASIIGVFVGGHAQKRWPVDHWLRLLARLEAERLPVLVFVGPEERAI